MGLWKLSLFKAKKVYINHKNYLEEIFWMKKTWWKKF